MGILDKWHTYDAILQLSRFWGWLARWHLYIPSDLPCSHRHVRLGTEEDSAWPLRRLNMLQDIRLRTCNFLSKISEKLISRSTSQKVQCNLQLFSRKFVLMAHSQSLLFHTWWKVKYILNTVWWVCQEEAWWVHMI